MLSSPQTNNSIFSFFSPMTFPPDKKGHCGCFSVLNDQATAAKENVQHTSLLEEG